MIKLRLIDYLRRLFTKRQVDADHKEYRACVEKQVKDNANRERD